MVELGEPALGLFARAGDRVHRIGVELGDDVFPEHLDHLDDLIVGEALIGSAERDLVTADVLVRLHLLAHLFGVAQQIAPRMTSSHMAFVSESSVPLNVATSWLPAPRPVPNSKRPSLRW